MLLALGAEVLAAAPTPQPRRYALVIGTNRPEANRQRLRYADDDAVATHQLLVQAGVQSQLLVSLDADSRSLHPGQRIDGRARWKRLKEALKRINEQVRRHHASGRTTELLLFFSGHGGVDRGEGYVLLEDRRLTRSMLDREILARSEASTNHVIVDACQSYYLAFERGEGGRRRPYGQPFADHGANPSLRANTGFVLSTSSDRESHEWGRYGAGVFSYQVRSGLRGAADVDGNGAVSYGELGAFLTAANAAIANARLRPDFVVRPPAHPTGSLSQTLLASNRVDSEIVLDRTHVGHVYIESAQGERILDAHPSPGQRFALRVPASRPLFVRRADGSWEIVIGDEGRVRLSALRPAPLLVASRGAVQLAFEQLFSLPFGKATVAAFYEQHAQQRASSPVPTISRAHSGAWRTTGTLAGWTALTASVVGVGLQLWALERYLGGKDASQEERDQRNNTITRLNTTAYVMYGLAGAGVLLWAASRIWPRNLSREDLVAVPMVGRDAVGLALSWRQNWETWSWSR